MSFVIGHLTFKKAAIGFFVGIAFHKKHSEYLCERAFKKTFSRKGAKKTLGNAAALCVFAPLRETLPPPKTLFVQSFRRILVQDTTRKDYCRILLNDK